MDPDEALKIALDAARAIIADSTDTINSEEAVTLAETFDALHTWLSRGGMLPAAWHLSTCMGRDCRQGQIDAAQAIWQTYAVETGRSLPPGLADKLAEAAAGRGDQPGRSAAEHGGE